MALLRVESSAIHETSAPGPLEAGVHWGVGSESNAVEFGDKGWKEAVRFELHA